MAIEPKDISWIVDIGENGFLVKTLGGLEYRLDRREGKELADKCQREKEKSHGFQGELAPGQKASFFQDGDEEEQFRGNKYDPLTGRPRS